MSRNYGANYPGGGSGSLVLVQTIVIGTTPGFTSETSAVAFSGLAGDTDGTYEVRLDCIAGSDSTLSDGCFLRPNALSTNLFSQGQYTQGLGSSPTTSQLGSSTAAYICLGGASGMSWTAQATIFPKSGKQRAYTVSFTQWDAAQASTRTGNMSGFWNDTSTPVTSLQFFSGHKMFGVGSTLSLWKRGI
jgi:hypothetical protein